MTSPTPSPGGRIPLDRLSLDFPRSLAVYDTYDDAQRAVDYLSDHEFPVQNVMIVGTDLKQVERVTGRLTWGKILAGGLLSGMWLGLFVGLIMSMFGGEAGTLSFVSALLTGAVFGLVWAALGYSLTRGKRDFTSISQVVATRYELLVEHALHDRCRDMLSQLPGGRPLPAPSSSSGAPARPNPYEGRYGVRVDAQGAQAPASPPQGTPSRGGQQAPSARENAYEGRYGVQTDTHTPPSSHGAVSAPGADDASAGHGSQGGGASSAPRPPLHEGQQSADERATNDRPAPPNPRD